MAITLLEADSNWFYKQIIELLFHVTQSLEPYSEEGNISAMTFDACKTLLTQGTKLKADQYKPNKAELLRGLVTYDSVCNN